MILIAYGTRPEYIKISPLLKLLPKEKYKTLFTGQHTDIISNSSFDYKIEIPNADNRLDSIVQSCLNKNFIFDGISHVLIQGDTTSAFAVALAAFHRKIKIIHLEAGLRSYDRENPYPEEANRVMISAIADYHLCPTEYNKKNLDEEKSVSGRKFVVGNTGLDGLVEIKKQSKFLNNVLITLHRRENHDKITDWFYKVDELAKRYGNYNFILPIHPNPNVKQHAGMLKYVKVVEPMNHAELTKFLSSCAIVISDSGGIQEECSFFGKKVLVCRKVTERPESLGKTSFLVDLGNIKDIFDIHIKNPYPSDKECPYGDGNSAEKIIKIFQDEKII
jgi:UDP-N-acetylglucosamine 2-epimerase